MMFTMMEAAPVTCVVSAGAVDEMTRPTHALGNAVVIGATVLPGGRPHDIRRREDLPDTM